MSADIKVSIIVPVYNVGKYVEKCLKSLVSQTLEDIEIITVNDGSTDGSQKVIDAVEEKYPEKIVVIEKENEGPGAARNLGVTYARGEYIGFVDADDRAAPDMFEKLYNEAVSGDYDVVICSYNKVFTVNKNNGAEQYNIEALDIWSEHKDKLNSVQGFVQLSTNPAMSWNKLYKKKLVLGTPFLPTAYYEDVATIPVILSNCERIKYIPEPLYFYNKEREGAITTQRNTIKNLDVLTAWDRCLNECNPRYIMEMEYAVYVSVGYFLLARREHLDEIAIYFWKNEERFKNNELIRKEILEDELIDLFKLIDKAAAVNTDSEVTRNLLEFLEETSQLISQLGKLSADTLTELLDMYNTAVQAAEQNAGDAGPKLLVQLSDRQNRIKDKLAQNPQ